MSKFANGGVVKHEEMPQNWMHPDEGPELLPPIKAWNGSLAEQNALLRAVLEAPRIPASVALSALRGDKDDRS